VQVLSLVAMEPPVSLSPEDIRDEKVKVLRCISPLSLDSVVLGQYVADAQGVQPGCVTRYLFRSACVLARVYTCASVCAVLLVLCSGSLRLSCG
jgi:hypothetical protein